MEKALTIPNGLLHEIKNVLESARKNVVRQVNAELLSAYWNIGRIIVEHEQGSSDRAPYGRATLRQLSRLLTAEYGKGFSLSNIYNMRLFYLCYPKFQTVSGILTWSHYCELLSIRSRSNRCRKT